MSRARNWCFTLNNFNDADVLRMQELQNRGNVDYFIAGRETGASGTPHLQGFLRLSSRLRLRQVSEMLGGRVHLEITRGTLQEAAEYCKKEDNAPIEFGQLPTTTQGTRTDLNNYIDWVSHLDGRPRKRDIIKKFPSLWLRHTGKLLEMSDALRARTPAPDVVLRPWQNRLRRIIINEANDRHIFFYVDVVGNTGKTFLAKQMLLERPDDVQILKIGKRDDLAHAIDVTKKIFFFDIPRSQMEYLQYNVLEQIKDGIVFSPKYMSETKYMENTPHVIVLCNEMPKMDQLSRDRYKIVRLANTQGRRVVTEEEETINSD